MEIWLNLLNTAGLIVIAIVGRKKFQEIHVMVNSRLSELLAVTKEAALSAGAETGRKTEIEESKNRSAQQ